MLVDPEYLRQHYASLSDEALLEIVRADLVETAQKCYDDELGRRKLVSGRGISASARDLISNLAEPADQDAEYDVEPSDHRDKPQWLDEGSEVFSQLDYAGAAPAPEVADARDALEAAGIPCYLELSDPPEEQPASRKPTRLWRLMVPGKLNQRATSILERDIFNADFEAQWKTHLEMLSDEDLLTMNPRVAFCGLFDRVERVTKAFDDEVARRRFKSESA